MNSKPNIHREFKISVDEYFHIVFKNRSESCIYTSPRPYYIHEGKITRVVFAYRSGGENHYRHRTVVKRSI